MLISEQKQVLQQPARRHPDWLKVRLPSTDAYGKMKALINGAKTNTVCEEAKCPNIGECWGHGTATFMILGDTCTRNCRYCHVKTGWPGTQPDAMEPAKVAGIVKQLGLKYVVITSVDRDDLPDGGSAHFAETVRQIHTQAGCYVEVLTPDYTGENLQAVLDAKPEVFGHNIETVRRIHKKVRWRGDYDKSLGILRSAKSMRPGQRTKTAMMVGFGETKDEIVQTLKDAREHGVDYIAMGQYLRPTPRHVPVVKYYTPDEFAELKKIGLGMGFKHIAAGPLVRSSYRADQLIAAGLVE